MTGHVGRGFLVDGAVVDGEEKLDWTGCMGSFLIITRTGKCFWEKSRTEAVRRPAESWTAQYGSGADRRAYRFGVGMDCKLGKWN